VVGFEEEMKGLKEEVEVMELGKGRTNILSPSKPQANPKGGGAQRGSCGGNQGEGGG